MVETAGRFVGIGVGKYRDPAHRPLTHAVSDVERTAAAFGAHLVSTVLRDPDRTAVQRHLEEQLIGSLPDGGSLVLQWSGHGVHVPGLGLRLLAEDSRGDNIAVVSAAEVVGACAQSGAHQLLIVVDTCFSGTAVPAATEVATELLAARPPNADHVWVGVLASTASADTAVDGLFGRHLSILLTRGPDDPDLRRRWSVHNALIRGDDLCDALLKEWDDEDQAPQYRAAGNAQPMLPNPLYDPGAPEQVVEHLLLAARGGVSAEHRSWFTGRTAEVDQVVAWVTTRTAGVRLVTGSPGTGKSAIVGRVVSATNPVERQRLLRGELGHADPGERSVHAHVHTRGLTADLVAEALDAQLVGVGLLRPLEDGRRNAAELAGAVQRLRATGRPAPVVVLDGLDEARGEAFTIVTDLVIRLGRHAVVVVATRDIPGAGTSPSLVEALGADQVLDLDRPVSMASGRRAIHDYVLARLTGIAPTMEPAAVARVVDAMAHESADRPFLLARLITDQLRADPLDTSTADWRDRISGSIEAAFDADLATAGAARTLLRALTWALGAGFPEEEWLTVANALSTGDFTRADISTALDQVGRYVVQDGAAGVAVYRLAHQSLADHLRPPFADTDERPFDPDATPVAMALLDRYRALIDDGMPARTPAYLWQYTGPHCALAGPVLVARFDELLGTIPELVPEVSLAKLLAGAALADHDHNDAALSLIEPSLATQRELADRGESDPRYLALALLAMAGVAHGLHRTADAIAAAEEAAAMFGELAERDTGYREDLADALNELIKYLAEVGRHEDAVAAAVRAVAVRRALAEHEPQHRQALAGALTDLGKVYDAVGRHEEAMAVAHEAVAVRRAAATDDTGRRALVRALVVLAETQSHQGRPQDAAHTAEEASHIAHQLGPDDVHNLSTLVIPLHNLAVYYHDLGQDDEAVATGEEAVATYRWIVQTDPANRADLATCLGNLADAYAALGREPEKTAVCEELVSVYRTLADSAPGYRGDLARVLSILSRSYDRNGSYDTAAEIAEHAVAVHRSIAEDDPEHLTVLGGALDDLSRAYHQIDREREAQDAAREAVRLGRTAVETNPAAVSWLPVALSNMGNFLAEAGRPQDALAATEEAADLLRGRLAGVASARRYHGLVLYNLAVRLRDLDREPEAVAAATESVEVMRALVRTADADLHRLATVLAFLGALAEPMWPEVLAEVTPAQAAELLLHRSLAEPAGAARPATWLAAASSDVPTALTVRLRDEARRHQHANPGWAAEWSARTGRPAPTWLLVDTGLLATARAWTATSSFRDERDFLAAHPGLLAPGADDTVAEAVLTEPDQERDRYLRIRTAAAAEGVPAAYHTLVTTELARQFVDADPAGKQALLSEYGSELVTEEVAEIIVEMAQQDENGLPATAATHLLAFLNVDAAAAERAFAAMAAPAIFPEVLAEIATGDTTEQLGAFATIALSCAADNTEAATSLFYVAVYYALVDDEEAANNLHSALTLDPGQRDAWLAMVERVGAVHPAVLALLPLLTATEDATDDD